MQPGNNPNNSQSFNQQQRSQQYPQQQQQQNQGYQQQGFGQGTQQQGYPQQRPQQQFNDPRYSNLPENPRMKNPNYSSSNDKSFTSTMSKEQSEFNEQRLLEEKLHLLPKQNHFKEIVKHNDKRSLMGQYITNFYEFESQKNERVFMYKVQTIPPVRADASKTWYRIINSLKFKLERDMKMITFRGDTVWAEMQVPTYNVVTSLDRKRKKPTQN